MYHAPIIPSLHRFTATQTLPGRCWLSFHVALRRWLWRWLINGADAVKRLSDLIFSGIALVLLAPLFAVIALLIKWEDGGPVIFVQTRIGKFGHEFKMYKFRSMCLNAEARLQELLAKNQHKQGVTFKLKDDPRLTRVGKWLRKFSFDELPQFFNVWRGEMSLVGPRPPVQREVALYSQADRRRLAAKPGITCFWQISGRAEIDFSGQVKLDVKYIENQNLLTDFIILARTVPAVLSGKGAC
jgi:lipopolysaccharide/colanic/teichoic acid biosynthesis glycosyltransferase